MKNKIFIFIILWSVGLFVPVGAKLITQNEARMVANNWIKLIINKKGSWDNTKDAYVKNIKEFKRGNKTIGYFFEISPRGFIIVSLLKGLAPVKAYSDNCNLDPYSDEGLSDLLKSKMENILNLARKNLGNLDLDSISQDELAKILRIDYSPVWDILMMSGDSFETGLDSGEIMSDYSEGEQLLTSNWHQGNPYNTQCPTPADAGSYCEHSHCYVGCVATAGSQILHYWNWPPYGDGGSPYNDSYSWLYIPDTLRTTSSTSQIDATAELCHEFGEAANIIYCDTSIDHNDSACISSGYLDDAKNAFRDNFRYANCSIEYRDSDSLYTADEWFSLIQEQLNLNRPIEYGIKRHAIVCDGWQIIADTITGDTIKQYHMNYGWANSYNAWYTLDDLYQTDSTGTPDDEQMIIDIYPTPSIGGSFSGTYTRDSSFPYRYFTRDATCADTAIFNIGQSLQFLPHIEVKCDNPSGYILFNGSAVSGYNERLFSINNKDIKAEIRIYDAGLKIHNNGGIRFHGE